MDASRQRPAGSRLGHVGPRHPLCPECGYDLVATIAARRRQCPECGNAFEMHELVTERRDGDWTPWYGVRRASLVLTIKGVVCAIAFALALTAEHRFGQTGVPRLMLGVVVLVTGGIVGWVLAHRVEEHVGFAGPLVGVGLILVMIVVLIAGATLAIHVGGAVSSNIVAAVFISGLASTGFIVKKAVIDEQ